jgi:hypoxanthine phosphoribosyltransferase
MWLHWHIYLLRLINLAKLTRERSNILKESIDMKVKQIAYLIELIIMGIGTLASVFGLICWQEPWRSLGIILVCVMGILLITRIVLSLLPSYISWRIFPTGVSQLIKRFNISGYSPDLIVGVGRSGSIIGGMIAANLGHRPFIALDVQYDKEGPGPRESKVQPPYKLDGLKLKDKKILLTFCYIKTGQTLQKARHYMLDNGVTDEQMSFATLFLNPDVEQDMANIKRFYFADQRRLDSVWLQTPWSITREYDYR